MKTAAVSMSKSTSPRAFWANPTLWPASRWQQGGLNIPWLLASQFGYFMLSLLWIVLGQMHQGPLTWTQTYAYFPLVFFVTGWMGATAQLFCSLTGKIPAAIHDRPYLATSLSEFWSKRWNRWVSEWLHHLGRRLGKRHVMRGMWAAFAISALFHEVMFNLPDLIAGQPVMMGNMTAYFGIQALGTQIERRLLKQKPVWLRTVFCWLFVLGPSPLFITGPFLKFFGIGW